MIVLETVLELALGPGKSLSPLDQRTSSDLSESYRGILTFRYINENEKRSWSRDWSVAAIITSDTSKQ